MARFIITNGTKIYYDEENRTHREDGPAVIRRSDGAKEWRIHNLLMQSFSANGTYHNFEKTLYFTKPNGFTSWYSVKGRKIWPKL